MTYTTLYPVEWPQLAAEIKRLCDYCCQQCSRQCRRPGEAFDTHARTLALCHITQDYEADVVQVAVLCRDCHLRHDARYSGLARRRRERLRRRLAGQMLLPLKSG